MPPNEPSPQFASGELLHRLRAGDEAAATEVFERYAERLTKLARVRLAAKLAARLDAEDVVMSAYRSFFVAARQGRFQLERGGDLWRLLVEITLHKLYRSVSHHNAHKRTVQREHASTNESAAIAVREPTPEEAALAADELEALLARLPESGRKAVELRLQGYEHEEIASSMNCSERTVRRWLNEARRIMVARAGGDFVPSAARQRPAVAVRPRNAALAGESLEAPLLWGDFVLKEQIGAGATGKVFRALQKSRACEVAVKFLKKALVGNRSVIEQFLREVRTAAHINHPGIVAVQGIGRTPGGGLFLAMELIRGRNLEQIRQAERVDPRQAAAWIADAAEIVDTAHQRGVIHCDLKPSNLLLDERGQIRVTDFGMAVQACDAASGLFAGTPAFMAPEQVDSCWGPVSPRTDVWGLGATLYFLLFGRPPHAGSNLADVIACVVSGTPISFPDRSIAALPSPLLAALQRSLAKPAAKRFASALNFRNALRAAQL